MGCGASAGKYESAEADKPGQPDRKPHPLDPVTEEKLGFLSKVPLFKQLPAEHHGLLAKACEPKEFAAGEVVIRQGDMGEDFFIIRSGEASVSIAGAAEGDAISPLAAAAHLKAGDYFGEKALVQDIPRSATIKAVTQLSTLQINRQKFRELELNEKLHFNRRKALGKNALKTMAKEPTDKTEADRLFIRKALMDNENLQVMVTLDDERIEHMIDAFWKESVGPWNKVISKDDATADYFYIIQDGNFQVSRLDEGQPNSAERTADHKPTVKKLGPGNSFGEMALLCLAPRSATVTSLSDATLWVVDRDNFKTILMKNTDLQIKQQVEYVEGVEILKCLLPSERLRIAEAFLELHFEKGEIIFEQGQQGTAFYVLVDGELAVLEDEMEIAKLSACAETKTTAFFGEMALLRNEPRTATVKATSDTAKVLVLDRESFDMLLGPLENIMVDAKEQGGVRTRSKKRGDLSVRASTQSRSPIFRNELKHVGVLGCGGFGTVELCEHKKTQQFFALKSMSKGHIVETGMQACVMKERQILWMCDSPFIIRLYAAYNTPQSLQLLLEVALGGDLYVVFNRRGLNGSVPHVVFYSAGVICAFQHLHNLKVVYRDLKPENVLLNATGHVRLTDMGLATVCLGKTFTACGTPDYFAPEMLRQNGHSFGLDWWTFGVLIYELMAGSPPFESSDEMQIYRNIAKGIEHVKFAPTVTPEATKLIKALLHPDPHKRLPMKSGGVKNLERHPFFSGFDWEAFRSLEMKPPYVPDLKGPKDRKNFQADSAHAPPQVKYVADGSEWDKDFAWP